jgi:hypothetical protein
VANRSSLGDQLEVKYHSSGDSNGCDWLIHRLKDQGSDTRVQLGFQDYFRQSGSYLLLNRLCGSAWFAWISPDKRPKGSPISSWHLGQMVPVRNEPFAVRGLHCEFLWLKELQVASTALSRERSRTACPGRSPLKLFGQLVTLDRSVTITVRGIPRWPGGPSVHFQQDFLEVLYKSMLPPNAPTVIGRQCLSESAIILPGRLKRRGINCRAGDLSNM